MFAGLGGLDVACEWSFGAETAWQLDLTGAAIRRRHFPDAVQVEADVRTVDPLGLPPIDVLCGGFPCTDLSVAGEQAGLDGEKSGLYSEVLRFARVLTPGHVVMENVPALLHYRARLEADWGALGYGLTFVKARALDAGAPHRRARVFVVAQMGGHHVGVMSVDDSQAWTGRPWPTPTICGNDNVKGASPTSGDGLGTAVRPWATLTASEDKGRRVSIARRENPDMLSEQVRPWATPPASDASGSRMPAGGCSGTGRRPDGRKAQVGLNAQVRPGVEQVRAWPALTATDYKTPAGYVRANGQPGARIGEALQAGFGKRLNPDWTETLIGLPVGWTNPTGPRLFVEPRWPRGRYPESWDRSVLWPGFEWEPPRTIPDGQPMKGRPARIRACGNAVVPQQGAMAITAGLVGPAQASLFR